VSTTERETGFKDTIAAKAPKIKIVDFQYGMSDRARACKSRGYADAHPGLAGLFCSNESGAVGAVRRRIQKACRRS